MKKYSVLLASLFVVAALAACEKKVGAVAPVAEPVAAPVAAPADAASPADAAAPAASDAAKPAEESKK